MEFTTLLNYARDLKAENCRIIRDCLEKLQTLDDGQIGTIDILTDGGKDLETAILGVYEGSYSIYSNFYEFINNLIYNEDIEFPSYIELDYMAMYYRTFRYDDNLYIDMKEFNWCKDRDEYGTQEQKEQYKEYIKYNLKYSTIVEFYC